MTFKLIKVFAVDAVPDGARGYVAFCESLEWYQVGTGDGPHERGTVRAAITSMKVLDAYLLSQSCSLGELVILEAS